jgi:hypothetical protein
VTAQRIGFGGAGDEFEHDDAGNGDGLADGDAAVIVGFGQRHERSVERKRLPAIVDRAA